MISLCFWQFFLLAACAVAAREPLEVIGESNEEILGIFRRAYLLTDEDVGEIYMIMERHTDSKKMSNYGKMLPDQSSWTPGAPAVLLQAVVHLNYQVKGSFLPDLVRCTIAAMIVIAFMCLSLTAAAGSWHWQGDRAITDADHLQHPQDTKYYSEEWSATAYFAPKHNVNINLIHSNLTLKDDKAVFRVEENRPDGTRLKEEDRCSINQGKSDLVLTCGKGIIMGTDDNISIKFSGEKIQMATIFKAKADAWRPGNGKLQAAEDTSKFYDFMLMMPRAEVVAKLNGKTLKGNGVINHSYTNAGFHQVALYWLRCTYIDSDLSIIFAANSSRDGQHTGWVSVTDSDGNSYSSKDVTFTFSDIYEDPDNSGYSAAQSITITSTSGDFKLVLDKMKLRYKKSMLSHLSFVERFLVKQLSDPMRYSMGGKAKITWPVAGVPKTVEKDLVVIIKQMNEK